MRSSGKLVKPENMLKKKVGAGGFNDSDLVRAQQGIDNNKIDFRPLGLDLVKELVAMHELEISDEKEYAEKLLAEISYVKGMGMHD